MSTRTVNLGRRTLCTATAALGLLVILAGLNFSRLEHLGLFDLMLRFGTLVANDGISLTLAAGEVLALLGENGAGKSTLVSILFGHYRADAGSIEVEDVSTLKG